MRYRGVRKYGRNLRARIMSRRATKRQVADLIDRFLERRLKYPQEWNDFVECSQRDPEVEVYRKRCYALDPYINCPLPVDEDEVASLKAMVLELRTADRV
jgi:hypothetical protein